MADPHTSLSDKQQKIQLADDAQQGLELTLQEENVEVRKRKKEKETRSPPLSLSPSLRASSCRSPTGLPLSLFLCRFQLAFPFFLFFLSLFCVIFSSFYSRTYIPAQARSLLTFLLASFVLTNLSSGSCFFFAFLLFSFDAFLLFPFVLSFLHAEGPFLFRCLVCFSLGDHFLSLSLSLSLSNFIFLDT